MSSFDESAFERHAFLVLKKVLIGNKAINVITQKETLLTRNQKLLMYINESIEPSLMEVCNELQTLVYPSDLALFVLAAEKEQILDEALDVIDIIRQDRRVMSLNDLMAILSDSAEMPGAWAAGLYGELGVERDAKPALEVKKSSVNLADMIKGMEI